MFIILRLQLGHICMERFGIDNMLAMLFPTIRTATEGLSHISKQVGGPSSSLLRVLSLALEDNTVDCEDVSRPIRPVHFELHVLLLPACHWKLAKSFWQHAGMGISSRYAEDFLALMPQKTLRVVETNLGPLVVTVAFLIKHI